MEIFNLLKLSQAETLPIDVKNKITLRNLESSIEMLSRSELPNDDQSGLFVGEDGQNILGGQVSKKTLSKLIFIKNSFVNMISDLADKIVSWEPDSDSIWDTASESDMDWAWDSYNAQFVPEYIQHLSKDPDEGLVEFVEEKLKTNILTHMKSKIEEFKLNETSNKEYIINRSIIKHRIDDFVDGLGEEPIEHKDLKEIIIRKIGDIFKKDIDLENKLEESAQQIAKTIKNNVIKNLEDAGDEEMNLPNIFSTFEQDLRSNYESDAWEWWYPSNSDWLVESAAESETEWAMDNMDSTDRGLKGNLNIPYRDPDSPHPIHIYSGPLEYLSSMDSVKIDKDNPYDSLKDWYDVTLHEMEETTYEHEDFYHFYMYDIHNITQDYISLIKTVVNSDEYLKNLFSGTLEELNQSDLDTEETLNGILSSRHEELKGISYIVNGVHTLTESQKKHIYDTLGIDREEMAERLERLQELRRQKEEEQAQKRALQREKERQRKKLTEKTDQYKEEILQKDREGRLLPEGVEKAKELGIATKPFEHAYQMHLTRFPGAHAFHKDIQEKSLDFGAIPFTIALYGKDSGRVDEKVFTDMQYHRIDSLTFPEETQATQWDAEYHPAMGWVGGWIDVPSNTMYVGEIQSDLMQNTHEMKDSQIALKIKEEERNKITQQVDSLVQQSEAMDAGSEEKINLLKGKLELTEPGSKQHEGLSRAIENLESHQPMGVDVNKKEKIQRLKLLITQLNEQIEADRASKPSGGLARPHLHEYKSRVENTYKNWVSMFWNAIFRNIKKYNIDNLFVISAKGLQKRWPSWAKESTNVLFERVYDDFAQKFGGRKKGDWYGIPIDNNEKIIMASNWYKNIKTSQLENVDISDLLSLFDRGEISRDDLQSKIHVRYLQKIDPAMNVYQTLRPHEKTEMVSYLLMKLNIFMDKYVEFMKKEYLDPVLGCFEEHSNMCINEMNNIVRDAFVEFKKDIDDAFRDEDGDLIDPYRSIAQRYLIQNYDYDPYEDEYTF